MASRSLVALAALVTLAAAPAVAQRAPALSGGDHYLYIGTYAGDVQILDEATEKQVGSITLQTGIPRSLTLSHDRKRFYVLDATFEKIEVVDIASRTSETVYTMSGRNRHTRIRGLAVDPNDRYMILLSRTATKLVDRWEIGEMKLERFDFAENRVTRSIPWPDGEAREFINLRFSPDGKLLYFFGDDIQIVETENFTKVDTWALSREIEPGLGRIRIGAADDYWEDPGFFTGLFSVQDPVNHRRIMGIGRVDLAGKRIDFSPIGPAEGMSFSMAPDRKKGYSLLQDIGRYELWTFDLEKKSLERRQPFDGRPRMGLRVSSNGKLLYIFNAGATIDLYTADGFKYLRTIEMTADQTTALFVLPKPPGARPTAQ